MAIEWYYCNSYLALGIDWNASSTNTSVSIAPKIYRWDEYNTDNSGGEWYEALNPDAGNGNAYKQWGPFGWGSGSDTRQIDYFSARTYERKENAYTIWYKIWWYNTGTAYDGYYHGISDGENLWSYTVPALPSYKITYNANGGTGAPAAQTKWYGKTLTLSSAVPKRTNYKFLGWSTSATATSATYAAGSSYTANNGTTLYAVWALDIYTITYYNGDSSSSTNYNYGSSYTWPSVELLGWTFYGWSTSNTSISKSYSSGDNFKDIGTKTLYAIFYKNISVYNGSITPVTKTLYYNPSGGETATGVSVPAIDDIPTNWSAAGWSTSKNASAPGLSSATTETLLSPRYDITTLYSVYKRTVNIYNNSSSPSVLTRYRCLDSWSALPSQNSKSGWTSKGWRTDETADEGTAGNTTDSNSFYGIYSRTATFYTGENKSQSATQYWNSKGKYALTIPTPTSYSNYNWELCSNEKPWRTDTNAQEGTIGSGSYNGASNVFYATYKRKIIITYNNGVSNPKATNSLATGTVENTQTSGYQYYNASGKSAVSSLPIGTITDKTYNRVGYTFLGWYIGNTKQTSTSIISPAYNITSVELTAKWNIIQPSPSITNLTCYRVDKNGAKSDEGTYVYLEFYYSQKSPIGENVYSNRPKKTFSISSLQVTSIGYIGTNISKITADFIQNGTTYSTILKRTDVDEDKNGGGFSTETQYIFTISSSVYNIEGTNTASGGKSIPFSAETTLTKAFFTMDFLAGGTGIAIGAPSSSSGFIDNMETGIFKGFSVYPEEYNSIKLVTGGRNLINNSSPDSGIILTAASEGTNPNYFTSFPLKSNDYFHSTKKIKEKYTVSFSWELAGTIPNGKTISPYARPRYSENTYSISNSAILSEKSDSGSKVGDKGTSFTTFELEDGHITYGDFWAIFAGTTLSGTEQIIIRDFKFEKGPSKSSWTPAPEDSALLMADSNNGVLINSNLKTAGHIKFTKNDNNYLCGSGGNSSKICIDPKGTTTLENAVLVASANNQVYPGTTNLVSLGNSDHKWSNVYATTFTGNLTGNVKGNLTGDVTGNCSGSSTKVLDSGNNSTNTTFAYSKAGLSYGDYSFLAGWNGYELRAVHKNQFFPSTGGNVTGDIKITAKKALKTTDSNSRDYSLIYDNGDNLWIGASSSEGVHHSGKNGNTFISSGYSTTNSKGNSTIYVSIPTLNNGSWSSQSYGILHRGNVLTGYVSYDGGADTKPSTTGYYDKTVTFEKPFPSTPWVFVSFQVASTWPEVYIDSTISVHSITPTGCTIRLYTTSNISPFIYWMAFV